MSGGFVEVRKQLQEKQPSTWKHSATKIVYTARKEDIQGNKLRIKESIETLNTGSADSAGFHDLTEPLAWRSKLLDGRRHTKPKTEQA
jgi:hypothetical protein